MNHQFIGIALLSVTTALFAQERPRAELLKRESIRAGGGPVTYVYSGDGKRITAFEDDASIVQVLYDDAGVEIGQTVTPRGTDLALTVRYSGNRRFAVDGLPSIERVTAPDGRDLAIRTGDGTAIAAYEYRESGHTREVTVGDRFTILVSAPDENGVTQTLTTRQGKVLRESRVASGMGFIQAPVTFDAARAELGNIDAATRSVSAGNKLTTVRDAAGNVVLYLVNAGSVTVAFEADGTPLFYDIAVDQSARPHFGGGNDSQPDAFTDLSGVVPDHIVLTRSGMVGAYVAAASDGAVNSVWTERNDAGNVVVGYRSTTRIKDEIAPRAPGKLQPVSNAICYTQVKTTACVSGDGIPEECDVNWVNEPYYCSSPTTGGGTTTGPSGGGGTAGSGGNKVTGDMALKAQVDRSLPKGAEKLDQAKCAALLDTLTYGSGTPLRAMMNARGYQNPGQYLQQAMSYLNGFDAGKCNGSNVAYTTPFSRTIYVCGKLDDYSDTMAASLLIHEMLHSLGLPENPPTDGAMSSSQITAKVVEACGT